MAELIEKLTLVLDNPKGQYAAKMRSVMTGGFRASNLMI
jgi:hypothetical protein